MKWIRLLIYVVIVALTIFQFQGLEKSLNDSVVSWSFAKVAPYLTLLLGGFLIASWMRKNVVLKSKLFNRLLFWGIAIIPFGVGFGFNPIYQGDFAKNGRVIERVIPHADFINVDLLVITIPGCDYCYGSIPSLKLMKQRNPNMRIKMVVCSSYPKELKPYKKEIGSDFELQLASNPDSLAVIAGYAFPSFVMVKNNLPSQVWSNDQFGVRAKDVVEKYFKH